MADTDTVSVETSCEFCDWTHAVTARLENAPQVAEMQAEGIDLLREHHREEHEVAPVEEPS